MAKKKTNQGMRPATVRSIAAVCGMSPATVARAISGHPNVNAATRKKILAVAKKLKYRIDPAMAFMARRRWPQGPTAPSVTLAWLHAKPGILDNNREYQAAKKRVEELGYALDVFNMNDYRNTKKIERILYSRGIQGVLVQAFRDSFSLDLNWKRFFTVFVGPENDIIHVHNVQSDFRASVHIAVQECLRRGFRKIGFLLFDFNADGTTVPIRAQTLIEREKLQCLFGQQPPIQEFRTVGGNEERPDIRAVNEWFHKYRPEVVLTSNHVAYYWLTNPKDLGVSGFAPVRFPQDASLVILRDDFKDFSAARVAIHLDIQAREAVNLVHQNLQNRHLGLPETPMRILIPPTFVPGKTLGQKKSDAVR